MPRDDQRRRQAPQDNPERPHEQIKRKIASLNQLASYGAKELVEDAKALAETVRDLKTAQTRKIYGTVKSLEMEFQTEQFDRDKVILLRPKLAYAANKKSEVRPLQEVFDACIGKVRNGDDGRQDFARFVAFFEAILAYHRDRG